MWVLVFVPMAFFLGYYLRQIRDLLISFGAKLSALQQAQKKAEGPKTAFADTMTRAELAALAEEDRIKLLNP